MAGRVGGEPWLALLRGINVGGRNVIRMADLRAAFEEAGYEDVATYIQSGNVVFRAAKCPRRDLQVRIEAMLREIFDYDARVFLRTRRQLRAVVAGAPAGFGEEPGRFREDVLFLADTLTTRAALADVEVCEGVDQVAAGKGVLYFSRLAAQASKSRLSRLTGLPAYQRMTIRNWRTTNKLLAMMKA